MHWLRGELPLDALLTTQWRGAWATGAAAVGHARYHSPRHRMPFNSRQDGSKCVTASDDMAGMTRRGMSGRP